MKNILILLLTLMISQYTFSQLSPAEIIRKSEDKFNGQKSYAEMEMKIIRKDWDKTMTMKAWSVGREKSLVMITAPAREKGTVILRVEKDVWNWQPKIERVIKMPPSMMSQSWMGSDFSNDDLVNETSLADDFNHVITKDTTIEGYDCYMIESTPKDPDEVIWGKMTLAISKKDLLQLHVRFYDEDGYLVNTMIASDIQDLGGRTLPKTITIFPAEEPHNKTVMTYQQLDFNPTIANNFFTVQNMKRLR